MSESRRWRPSPPGLDEDDTRRSQHNTQVPEDVELQEQRQEFLVTKIIVDEADEEIDLEDDEFIEIDEPKVYQSDPCLREDAGGGDEDDGPGGEKKEADAEE